jgi:hypothetical protein
MDESLFVPDPYLTIKGDFHLIQTRGAENHGKVPRAEGVWGMTTILFSKGNAERVYEMMCSPETDIGPLDQN